MTKTDKRFKQRNAPPGTADQVQFREELAAEYDQLPPWRQRQLDEAYARADWVLRERS